MEQIFSAEIFFSETELGTLAGFYLGRVKDLSLENKKDENGIARCKHNASVFISHMPQKLQETFSQLIDDLMNDDILMNSTENFMQTIVDRLKNMDDS